MRQLQKRPRGLPSTDVVNNASVMVDTKMTKTVGEHWGLHDTSPARLGSRSDSRWIARTDTLAVGTLLPNRPMIEIQIPSTSADRPLITVKELTSSGCRPTEQA